MLGLTMAEVLILLLFVLLLALTSALAVRERAIRTLNDEAKVLGAALQAVAGGGALPEGAIRDLVAQATRAEALQRDAEQLRHEASSLRSRMSEAEGQLRQWQDLTTEARRADPNAPPAATLRRALEQAQATRNRPLTELQSRSSTFQLLEEQARRIDPNAPPAATITRALDRQVQRGTVSDVVVAFRDAERRLADRLQREFGQDLSRWNASLDQSSLTLRFANPEVLFEAGSATLRPSFETVLTDLFPRYLAQLKDFRDDIEEVRIEGHTSSEWRGTSSPADAYFRNMTLSQDRTRAVLEFGLSRTPLAADAREWARGVITANGLASSRRRFRSDGSEDREASRRVEFRVLMKLRENVLRVVDSP